MELMRWLVVAKFQFQFHIRTLKAGDERLSAALIARLASALFV